MTSFAYSAIGNGDSIAFEPATDVLVIDDASLSAADFILTAQADGAGVQWSLGAQSFTLAGVSLRSLTESNVQFADGSLLVNADVANGYSLSLVGSDLGDLLVGAGAPQTIDLAARTIAGELTNSYSDKPYVSADGRFVLFGANGAALSGDPDISGIEEDLFLRDLLTGTVTRVSEMAAYGQADFTSPLGVYNAAVSSDGRYVAFDSDVDNLVAGDTNGSYDIFLKDLKTGAITLVSSSSTGTQANLDGYTYGPTMSADGRYVAFVSGATNLVEGDTNDSADVFVKDLETGQLTRVSTSSSDVQGDGGFSGRGSTYAKISADGKFVVFESEDRNLVAEDTDGYSDVFVKNLQTGAIRCVSVGQDGLSEPYTSENPDISADGRYVVFESASNLLGDGRDGWGSIYLRDLLTDTLTRVKDAGSYQNALEPKISGDGRFVVFSTAAALVAEDTNGVDAEDVYVKDMRTGEVARVSVGADGEQAEGRSLYAEISLDGTTIVFRNDGSPGLSPDDNDGGSSSYVVGNPLYGRTLAGGMGDDVYVISNRKDVIVEAVGEGADTVRAAVAYTLTDNVEDLVLTGSAATDGVGNALDNHITGNGAANTLDGGAGADTMTGRAGDDTYVVDNVGDACQELTGEGFDRVLSSVGITLQSEIENLTLTGSSSLAGHGNALANLLVGNAGANALSGEAGNDTLAGGAGADSLTGGAGNDTYVVDATTDVISEIVTLATEIDTVRSAVTWTLGANLERLSLTGFGAINGTGNTLANSLTGNIGANSLNGGSGNDTLSGDAGNDTLDGSTGADSLIGGIGNDSYYVDSSSDKVTETSTLTTEIDTVVSSISWTLGNYVERLTLSGAAAINGTGNTLANTLVGNTGANSLNGGSGNDTLSGAAGNDTLDGSTGADSLMGGTGNDSYYVDSSSDKVTETSTLATEIDTVVSSISWTLGNYVERLTLSGTAAISGTGNTLANALTGNGGANSLNGGSGNDTLSGAAGNDILNGGTGVDSLIGGTGNDSYYVDSGSDKVTETSTLATEIDTVVSSISWTLGNYVERLTLAGTAALNGIGNSLGNILTGNTAGNRLDGGGGADTIDGKAGADSMTGGAGADTFAFTTGLASDLITDFTSGSDKLRVSQAAIKVGDGDSAVEGAVAVKGPSGFGSGAELVIVTHDIAGGITASSAAAAIGHASSSYKAGDTRLFVVDNGVDSAAYLFKSADAGATVTSGELTLLATLDNTHATVTSDFLFGA